MNVQILTDVCKVIPHRVPTHAERISNNGIRIAASYKPQYLALAGGQRVAD